MPFMKVGKNKYKSPSGRIWTKDQMRAYYAKKYGKKRAKRLAKKRAKRKAARKKR